MLSGRKGTRFVTRPSENQMRYGIGLATSVAGSSEKYED